MKAVIVYAYGEDPYMQTKYQDTIGVFTSTRAMTAALRADGLTEKQYESCIKEHAYDWTLGVEVQVDYNAERGDKSSYRLVPIELNKKL